MHYWVGEVRMKDGVVRMFNIRAQTVELARAEVMEVYGETAKILWIEKR